MPARIRPESRLLFGLDSHPPVSVKCRGNRTNYDHGGNYDMNDRMCNFMDQFPFEGLTFDDVSLVTDYASFLPDESDISSSLSTNVKVNVPLISAAMDTVTEHSMAIAMATAGGVGIIHKNLSAEEQAHQVVQIPTTETQLPLTVFLTK